MGTVGSALPTLLAPTLPNRELGIARNQREGEAMELEKGLNIVRSAQDLAFGSHETESAFVLLVPFPAEEREGMEIEVTEDGRELRISGGGGSTRARVLAGRGRLRGEEEATGRFRKAFRVPEGVDAQGIEAQYDVDEEVLRVSFPKLVTGASAGTGIEEVKQEEEREEADEEPPREPGEAHGEEGTPVLVEVLEAAPGPGAIAVEEPDGSGEAEEEGGKGLRVEVLQTGIEEGGEGEEVESAGRGEGGDGEMGGTSERQRRPRRRRGPFPFCTPLVLAGSAFFFLVVAVASHLLRERSSRWTR